ncbi:hypothetical protein HanIR_Chr17g0865311 [Helianthus annuus]|nr:hypothetical protein HanIR_Chr17g0865311 [Helianthus annuus]
MRGTCFDCGYGNREARFSGGDVRVYLGGKDHKGRPIKINGD